MKRDFVESLIMGYLATYLPIFDFSVGKFLATISLAWPIFLILVWTERHKMMRVGDNTYLYINTNAKKIKEKKLSGGGKKWTI